MAKERRLGFDSKAIARSLVRSANGKIPRLIAIGKRVCTFSNGLETPINLARVGNPSTNTVFVINPIPEERAAAWVAGQV